ncbi:MAG: hypothetical protein IJC88_05945 [Oscillospiraceae bacterium]|nr:hypothetical protein [Oscillospiraceae bacterium]
MKKRILSLTLALVMLLGMLPGTAAIESVGVDFTKTYTNIFDAGFDPEEIMKDFPLTVEMTYDAETETLKMKDIGATSATAYYSSHEMTLEDGYWTAQISPEEHEGAQHSYRGSNWMAVYNSDGNFEFLEFNQDDVIIDMFLDLIYFNRWTDTHAIRDIYSFETGELYLQNVSPIDISGDHCDVYYNVDGTVEEAHIYINRQEYYYRNGEWVVVPSKFATEEEMKAACPFVKPIDVNGVALTTADGAQIRVATERPQGLRFVSVIEKNDAYSNVREFGTVLIPTESLDDGDIENLVIGKTMSNGHAVQKVPAVNFFGEDEESVTFTAVITNIAEANYTRSYTARAYAVLDDDTVVYGSSYASRSIYQIAKLILESDTATDAEIEAAQAIVDVVEGYGDNDASWPWN